jgi:hypothetical protein
MELMVGVPIPINPDQGSTTNPLTSRISGGPGMISPNAPQMVKAIGYADQMFRTYGNTILRGSQRTYLQNAPNYMDWMNTQSQFAGAPVAQSSNPAGIDPNSFLGRNTDLARGFLEQAKTLFPGMTWLANTGLTALGPPAQVGTPSPDALEQTTNLPATAQPSEYAPITGSAAARLGAGKEDRSIFASIDALERSYEARYANVAREVYSFREDKNQFEMIPGRQVIGMEPGRLVARMGNRPEPGAPLEEWKQYEQQLRTAIRKPLYTLQEYTQEFNKLGDKGIRDFQKRLVAAGVYSESEPVILGMIGDTETSAMSRLMNMANNNGMTYEQVLDELITSRKQAQAAGTGGGGGGGMNTQVTYSTTSVAQARQILGAVLQQSIGRNPTDQELSQFLKMLNAEEAKSPTITTSTMAGSTQTYRTTPTKVDPNNVALQFAKQLGDGDEYRENRAMYYLNLIAKKYGYGYGQG